MPNPDYTFSPRKLGDDLQVGIAPLPPLDGGPRTFRNASWRDDGHNVERSRWRLIWVETGDEVSPEQLIEALKGAVDPQKDPPVFNPLNGRIHQMAFGLPHHLSWSNALRILTGQGMQLVPQHRGLDDLEPWSALMVAVVIQMMVDKDFDRFVIEGELLTVAGAGSEFVSVHEALHQAALMAQPLTT